MHFQQAVIFRSPRTVTISEEAVPNPGRGEVLVQAQVSAISPGTEMLFYRCQIPDEMPIDATIESLSHSFAYPLRYGYAFFGEIAAVGADVEESWLGKRVFVFAPHQRYAVSRVSDLLLVPENLSTDNAVLLPFMETAVSFLMDAQPVIGERVVVFGHGVIGLLVTVLLAWFPLSPVVSADPLPLRRAWSRRLGASAALDPAETGFANSLEQALGDSAIYRGADLVFELSGNPQALNQAVSAAGFDGRVLIGSWYGQKTAPIDLGGHFHRSQIRLISSQVSHIAPRWRGCFQKQRRLQIAWRQLADHQPQTLITHLFPIARAAEA